MSDPEGSGSDNTPLTMLAELDEPWSLTCEGMVGMPCTADATWTFTTSKPCCEKFALSWVACDHHARWLMTLPVGHCLYCGARFHPGAAAYGLMDRLNPTDPGGTDER